MVEAALVFPLVMLLILGILEGALMFRTYLSANSASNSAARIGSIDGQVAYSDYDILQAVVKGAPGASENQITEIIVYKASGPGAGPSGQCITAAEAHQDTGVTGTCNVYINADLHRPESDFGQPLGSWAADQYWKPQSRIISLSSGPSLLGVWVQMQCQCISQSLFGISPQLHSTTVIQLEPETR